MKEYKVYFKTPNHGELIHTVKAENEEQAKQKTIQMCRNNNWKYKILYIK